jgi:hypothetical protein
MEGLNRFSIGNGDVGGPAVNMEIAVLRSDAGVVQAGGDGIGARTWPSSFCNRYVLLP